MYSKNAPGTVSVLLKFTDLKSAIADYEEEMFTRFAEKGKETMDNTDFMHSPEGLKKLLEMFNQFSN